MKKLSSSPSSSFSSSTTTTTCVVDGNTIHTTKSSALACISGMVRRLLCRNTLPTYPCDQLKLYTNHHHLGSDVEWDYLNKGNQDDEKLSTPAGPGLVARLMGLESLPQVKGVGHDHKSSHNSISRSRSMNSVDAHKGIDSIQGRNRRVKSFRENPTFVEDEEFLILSFESEEKKLKSKQSKVKTTERRQRSKRQRSINLDKNKENQEPDLNASSENSIGKILNKESTLKGTTNIHPDCAAELENSLPRIRMEKSVKSTAEIEKDENEMNVKRPTGKTRDNGDCFVAMKIEAELDSSPNSVLDPTVFPCEITHSGDHSKTRRRTLAEELQNYRKLNFTDTKSSEKTEKNRGDVKFMYRNKPIFVKICGDIRKLVEKEEATESVWRYDYKGIQNLEVLKEEIVGEMELQILDDMVDLLVDELCR